MNYYRLLALIITLACTFSAFSQQDTIAEAENCPNELSGLENATQDEELTPNYKVLAFASPQDYSSYQTYNSTNRVSDGLLMKKYIIDDANRIKKTGRIGGGCLILAGIAVFSIPLAIGPGDGDGIIHGALIGGGAVIGGLAWIIIANARGNKMINEARYLSLYEHNIFKTKNGLLNASIDFVNQNGLYKSNGIGLSIKYTL